MTWLERGCTLFLFTVAPSIHKQKQISYKRHASQTNSSKLHCILCAMENVDVNPTKNTQPNQEIQSAIAPDAVKLKRSRAEATETDELR